MELRNLRYFVALAEELSFTKAAQRLHISQPPLSVQIAQLEEEIGVPLFTRTSRSVQLTPAGEVFLNDTRSILDRLSVACDRARSVGSGLAGRIDIGLSGSQFQGPLPSLIAKYMQMNAGVSIVLHESRPADQLEELRRGSIDLSISRTPVNDSVLRSQLLFNDPVVVALPAGHRLGGQERLKLSDLAAEPFIMLRTESSAFARMLFDSCIQAGFAPKVVQWVLEVPAITSLVAAGIGVGFVPRSAACARDDCVYRALDGDVPRSGVYVVQRCNETNRVAEAFVRMLEESDLSRWQGGD